MPTLQQVADALKKADAAGDANGARKLAALYRSMQSAAAPSDAVAKAPADLPAPGSKEYAQWAAQQARAGKVLHGRHESDR